MLNNIFLQRPVEWILLNPSNETALIIIPEEAELLIPVIRAQTRSKVHLVTYAAPVIKNMLQFNRLSYYALPRFPVSYKVPERLSIELGIFAGRLYLDFQECASLRKYLQLTDKTDTGTPRSNNEQFDLFTENPVGFLLEWLTVRRKGQDIMHTPMGYICLGRPLHENHPFFAARRAGAEVAAPSVEGRGSGGNVDESEGEDTDVEDGWDPMVHLG